MEENRTDKQQQQQQQQQYNNNNNNNKKPGARSAAALLLALKNETGSILRLDIFHFFRSHEMFSPSH